jgi:hypothetical protein
MTPTADQIRIAQDAGNAAFDTMTEPEGAYYAYRLAYDATLAALQYAALKHGAKLAHYYPAAPLSDDDYERMSAGLPDGIVEHDDWLAGAP